MRRISSGTATELDIGDPLELAAEYRQLRQWLPGVSIMGGCCGTDHRHVQAILDAASTPGKARAAN